MGMTLRSKDMVIGDMQFDAFALYWLSRGSQTGAL